MLKWVRRILLFLVLGAVVNVAVAWGLALPERSYWANPATEATPEQGRWWRSNYPYRATNGPWSALLTKSVGFEAILLMDQPRAASNIQQAMRVRTGLPLKSLEYQKWESAPRVSFHYQSSYPGEVRSGLWQIERRAPNGNVRLYYFPVSPIWFGFGANTICYGIILWLILLGRRDFRLWSRTRRKQCLKCGYPRGASPVCTECGEALAGWASGP